jgi:hypothetical protein
MSGISPRLSALIRQAHAYEVQRWIGKRMEGKTLRLSEPVSDLFYCRKCPRRVTVTIAAPLSWV